MLLLFFSRGDYAYCVERFLVNGWMSLGGEKGRRGLFTESNYILDS